MQFRPLLKQLCFMAMTLVSGNQLAFAIENLPEITVTAPKNPLSDQINNPQLLVEEDIDVGQ